MSKTQLHEQLPDEPNFIPVDSVNFTESFGQCFIKNPFLNIKVKFHNVTLYKMPSKLLIFW